MRLLIDTDAFCKLAASNVLDDALGLLGVTPVDCGRLPALPHMLSRGRLYNQLGVEICEEIRPLVAAFSLAPQPGDEWLDKLASVSGIDPGEALLFAAAAEGGLVVVSGDKRALGALKDVEGFAHALSGRIVVLEAILIALCDHLGTEEVRRRVARIKNLDTAFRVCFSPENPDPVSALQSYFRHLEDQVRPLNLWAPRGGNTR